MSELESAPDYYELLQISSNAEPETIHRVYRLLAQRYHPDNLATGDVSRFRSLHEAYTILSDPEKRARYDVLHEAQRQTRYKVVSTDARGDNEFELENVIRLAVLEVLYANRRADMNNSGVFLLDLERLTGHPREHLEFTIWYLVHKRLVQRGDNAVVAITAEGVDYLEQRYYETVQRRRLKGSSTAAA